MSDAPTPDEVFADLDDEQNAECLYLDREMNDDAYLWAGEEDCYYLLERTRSGTWMPLPRLLTPETAEAVLEATIDADTESYEVRPQTTLPPGRHHTDRE